MGASSHRIDAAQDAWRSQLWPIPILAIVMAITLGLTLPEVDRRLHRIPGLPTHLLFDGGPEASRGVLAAVAASLVTVTSLTFSLTVVTLQLASSQHSPRVLRTFARDRVVHLTLALLLGTFVYTLTVMRSVRTGYDGQDPFVPHLSVTLAYLLAVASVIMLVLFLAHLTRKIRVESMLRDVHVETNETLHRLGDHEQADAPAPVGEPVVICAASSGFLTFVDESKVLAVAEDTDAVVHIHRRPGESIIAGTPVALAWRASGRAFDDDARDRLHHRIPEAVITGFERTPAQDPAYGLRQIVDIALRALSPGLNDPTTAVHALSHAAALLCRTAQHAAGQRVLADDEGRARVVLDGPSFADLLHLAIAQPARYGAEEPEVLSRLLTLLREVAWVTRAQQQHDAVRQGLGFLREIIEQHRYTRLEREKLHWLAQTVEQALQHRWPVIRLATAATQGA